MHRLVAVVIAILLAAPATAQSPDNAVWATDDQSQVYRWDPARREFGLMPGSMKQVSIGTDGTVWGVDPNENAYRWTGAQWQPIPARVRQISVRSSSEVWAINPAGQLFRWNGTGWEPVETPSGIKHVAVGGDGSVWMLDGSGNLARRENNGWAPVPCLITDGVLRRDGTTWTITRSIEDPTPSPGVPCAPDSLKLKQVWASDAQKVFGVDERGLLARWTATGWYIFESRRADVAYSADGELWVVGGGSVYFSKDQKASWERMKPFSVGFKSIAVGAAAVSSPTPPPSESGLSPAEEQEALAAHNSERQNYSAYGVGPLQWSPELARYAHEWAQRIANEGRMVHRPNTLDNPFRPNEYLGENIYGAASTGPVAVQSWASEKQWYHYDRDDGMAGYTNQPPGCTAPSGKFCGHFTQVVWKATRYVGCGRASAANGGTGYFICNYYPGGNYSGQKPY